MTNVQTGITLASLQSKLDTVCNETVRLQAMLPSMQNDLCMLWNNRGDKQAKRLYNERLKELRRVQAHILANKRKADNLQSKIYEIYSQA